MEKIKHFLKLGKNPAALGRKCLVLALAAMVAAPAVADDDFGLWTSIAAEKKFNKKISLEAGIDFRSEQKLKSVSRWSGSLGVGYKPWKFLKFSAGYAYIYDRSVQEAKVNYTNSGNINGYNVDHGYWRSKHRAYVDATGKLDVGRFSFSLRERYQYTHTMGTTCLRDRYRDTAPGGYSGDIYYWNGEGFIEKNLVEDDKSHKNNHYFRSRLQVSYDIKGVPLEPFVSYEISNNLSDGFALDKTRITVGTDWKINKKHKLSLAYLYQDGADDDSNDNIHVIDLGYKFEF